MPALLDRPGPTLADLLENLGGISPNRIGLPVGTATEKDLLRFLDGDEKRLFELVDGFLVEKVMGMAESGIAVRLVSRINPFVEDHDLGRVYGADGPFRVRVGRVRMPDVSYFSWERLDFEVPRRAIFDAIPDLAVEVISEGNTNAEMDQKLEDYFQAKVRLVWLIYPKTQTAEIYTSPTKMTTIDKDGILDGGKVLLGFRLALSQLFPPTRPRRKANGKGK